MSFLESEDEGLDGEVIESLSSKIEQILDETFDSNPDIDPRLEMLTVFLSFASHIADDLGLDQGGFTKLCSQFYQETLELKEEPQLLMAPVAKYHKPN